ncbi:uracil-DNA glycosylase [Kitasatospora sp. NPDC088391]|uniref:uracil-DNA glycosylase n=1 Tax=Kitasatospora sp. NPDC088391 TaxID=3364074 RepID=UPI00382B9B5A
MRPPAPPERPEPLEPPAPLEGPESPLRQLEQVHGLAGLDARVVDCRACPRLVEWREETARVKRRSFQDQEYWGRPIPGFGPADAGLLLVGLAPAAHGGNRTGRIFTGDPSGDLLYASLHRLGLANRPHSVWRGDGLELAGVRITDPVRCAPPENRPTNAERDTCRPWIVRELAYLRPTVRAVVALGGFAWQAVLPALAASGWRVPRPKPKFGHGAHAVLPAADGGAPLHLFGCFHVSPRNTYTGRLTPAMVDELLRTAALAAGLEPTAPQEPTAPREP